MHICILPHLMHIITCSVYALDAKFLVSINCNYFLIEISNFHYMEFENLICLSSPLFKVFAKILEQRLYKQPKFIVWTQTKLLRSIISSCFPFSLRTSETNYLNEAFSFYAAIRGRAYYSRAVREDRYELLRSVYCT